MPKGHSGLWIDFVLPCISLQLQIYCVSFNPFACFHYFSVKKLKFLHLEWGVGLGWSSTPNKNNYLFYEYTFFLSPPP
jgi:hypothetical protein